MSKVSLLFVTNLHFNKKGNGGQQRTFYLIKELSKHFNLTVVSPYSNKDFNVKDIQANFIVNKGIACVKRFRKNKISRLFFRIVEAFSKQIVKSKTIHLSATASLKLSNQLNKLKKLTGGKDIEIIVFDTLSTVVPLNRNLYKKRILNAHNFDYELVRTQYNLEQHTKSSTELKLMESHLELLKKYEFNLDNYFEELWVCSTEDIDKFKAVNSNTDVRIFVLPNGSDIKERLVQPYINNYHKFLFVGSLNYAPNVNGLKWFVPTVFKYLDQAYQLNVVGKSPKASDFKFLNTYPNINLIGEVDDVENAYMEHDVLIVPLLEGSGTRLKILEAMSYGKLVISTAKGIEGINAINGIHYLEFNNQEEFEAIVLPILEDRVKLEIIRANGRALLESTYDWSTIVSNYVIEAYE